MRKNRLNTRLMWGLVVVLTLLMASCYPSGLPNRHSDSQQGLSGLIAYVGNDGNIYIIDQLGENKRAVTGKTDLLPGEEKDSQVYQHPTWSPDGNRLAYVGVQETDDSVRSVSLYTVVPDGSNLVETFSSQEQSPFYLYWSPDSQRVSFLASAITVDGLILQMVSFDGGETQLLGIGQPYYWAWSPDSQTILIHTGGSTQINPHARLSLLNINGEVVESGLNLRPSSFQAPAWSPDGKALLLAAEVDEVGASLLITDVNGEIQTILESVGRSIAFAWSPDGKRVAYIMENPRDDEESAGILVIVDPDRVQDVQTVDQKPVVAFFWSPDSKKIAYFVPRLKIPSGEITQVGLPDPVLVLQLYLTDVYTGESWRLIEFTPTQDFLRIMEFFDQYHRSATIWSPDSQDLVILGMDQDENPGIMVISASQEVDSRIIAPGTLAFWSWK